MQESRRRPYVSKPSKPSGLLVPVRATLKGRVRWQVLDERGQPEAPRNESGFAVAPVEGVEQDNLITNHGMDRLAEMDAFMLPTTSGFGWRRRLAVGTGSTAPAFSDVALANEVQRAATSGDFSPGSNAYALDDVENVWRATSLARRLVTMTANRNLTEFGLAQEEFAWTEDDPPVPEAHQDIHVRELLRDSGGTPITVTVPSGKSLRVDHTLIVELPAPAAGTTASINIEEYNVGGTLVGTTAYTVVHGGHVHTANNENATEVFKVWNPQHVTALGRRRLPISKAYGRVGVWTSSGDISPNSSTSVPPDLVLVPYTGSYQRITRHTSSAAQENGDWYGYAFTNITAGNFPVNRSGWFVAFSSPATYTKVDTDSLRVGLVSSWARG